LRLGGGKARSFGKAKVVTNIGTMCRVDSCNTMNCLGIRSAQINVVPVRRWIDDVQTYSMVLGVRSNVGLNIPKPKGSKKAVVETVEKPTVKKAAAKAPAKKKAAVPKKKAAAKKKSTKKSKRTEPRLRVVAEPDTVEVKVEDAPTDVVEAPAPEVDVDMPADVDLEAEAERSE